MKISFHRNYLFNPTHETRNSTEIKNIGIRLEFPPPLDNIIYCC